MRHALSALGIVTLVAAVPTIAQVSPDWQAMPGFTLVETLTLEEAPVVAAAAQAPQASFTLAGHALPNGSAEQPQP